MHLHIQSHTIIKQQQPYTHAIHKFSIDNVSMQIRSYFKMSLAQNTFPAVQLPHASQCNGDQSTYNYSLHQPVK